MMTEVSVQSAGPAPVIASLSPEPEPYLLVFHVNDSTDDQVLFQAACRKGNVPFNWHVADSAEKGISYLRTLVEHARKMPVCWPDLILLDVVMPIRSGLEVLKFIRATPELKHLPVVIFTAALQPDCEKESLRLGANLFLVKPLDFTAVVELASDLYKLMRQMRGQDGPPEGT